MKRQVVNWYYKIPNLTAKYNDIWVLILKKKEKDRIFLRWWIYKLDLPLLEWNDGSLMVHSHRTLWQSPKKFTTHLIWCIYIFRQTLWKHVGGPFYRGWVENVDVTTVRSSEGSVHCDKCIKSSGSWTSALLTFFSLPLETQVTLEKSMQPTHTTRHRDSDGLDRRHVTCRTWRWCLGWCERTIRDVLRLITRSVCYRREMADLSFILTKKKKNSQLLSCVLRFLLHHESL